EGYHNFPARIDRCRKGSERSTAVPVSRACFHIERVRVQWAYNAMPPQETVCQRSGLVGTCCLSRIHSALPGAEHGNGSVADLELPSFSQRDSDRVTKVNH